MLASCRICERRCAVDRTAHEPCPCGLTDRTYTYKRYVSLNEELELVPSLRLFLSGCNFRCRFCDEAPQCFQGLSGTHLEPEREIVNLDDALDHGVKSISLLGGEPSLHPHTILAMMAAWVRDKSGGPEVGQVVLPATPGGSPATREGQVNVPLTRNNDLPYGFWAPADSVTDPPPAGTCDCAAGGVCAAGASPRTSVTVRMAGPKTRHRLAPGAPITSALPNGDGAAGLRWKGRPTPTQWWREAWWRRHRRRG